MDVVVYGVLVPGCEGRVGMAAIVEDLGEQLFMRRGLDSYPHALSKLKSRFDPTVVYFVLELKIEYTFDR